MQNSHVKKSFSGADLGSTRHVSLGRSTASDFQIVTVERSDSVSSSSTEYEDVDLTMPSDSAFTEDKRVFHNSDKSDSDFDVDIPNNEENVFENSFGEEDGTFETVNVNEDEDERENSLKSYEEDQEIDNATDDSSIGSNGETVNSFDCSDEDVGSIDGLSKSDNSYFQDDSDLSLEIPVDSSSDEDQVNGDHDEDSISDSDIPEQDPLESDDKIDILNDIYITIPNESQVTTKVEKGLAIVDSEAGEDDGKIEHKCEDNSEQINHEDVAPVQHVIISFSDDEKSDLKVTDESKKVEQHHSLQTKLPVVKKRDKENLAFSSSEVSSEITEKTHVKAKALLDVSKATITKEEQKCNENVKKVTDSVVKSPSVTVKTKTKSSGKPELANTNSSKIVTDSSQENLPKKNVGQKANKKEDDKRNGKLETKHDSFKAKIVSKDSTAVAVNNKAVNLFVAKTDKEKEMDFDQLSIEDEDDFIEEEEEGNLPAVKSKVGLNKIPSKQLISNRSPSRERRRKRRYSYSPDRCRNLVRPYHDQSTSRDRRRDYRFHWRSENGNRRRSLSPQQRERTYRGSYSRSERSRSRERTQSRFNTVVTKSRASRHYHSRSRSRSPSRNKSERTRKALKPRESIHTSVKERLEIKKTGDARSLLTRSDVRTCDSSVSKKSVSNKDSKLTTDLPLANGAILESKHKTVTVRASEVKTKQQKGQYCVEHVSQQFLYPKESCWGKQKIYNSDFGSGVGTVK